MDSLALRLSYTERGLDVIPLRRPDDEKPKAPFHGDWTKRSFAASEVASYVNAGHNVGLRLGRIVDIDCDCAEAVQLARTFLPETPAVFGRQRNPRSHYLFRLEGDPLATVKFNDPVIAERIRAGAKRQGERGGIVEFRGDGGQTVLPGSTYENGDACVWLDSEVEWAEPAAVEGAVLLQAVGRLAAASLLARYWHEGMRSEGAMALAGWLGRHWPHAEARKFALAVASAGGDDEDRTSEVDRTLARLERQELHTTGHPRLKKLVPAEVLRVAAQWLSLTLVGAEPEYAQDELGNAKRLHDQLDGNVRHVTEWKDWLLWDGKTWQPDKNQQIRRAAYNVGEELLRQGYALMAQDPKEGQKALNWAHTSMSARGTDGMLKQLAGLVAVDHKAFDTAPNLITCANGTVELITGTLVPHDPAHLITKYVDSVYDEQQGQARDPIDGMPVFANYLETTFVGRERVNGEWVTDGELVDFVQLLIGYAITGETKEQRFPFLYGRGGNGKGKLLGLIGKILKDHCRTASHNVFIKRRGDHDTILADLEGCRICLTQEVEAGEEMAISVVKQFTGEDEIACRRMGTNMYRYWPVLKLFMVANLEPVINDDSDGPWRRIMIIPFNRNFDEEGTKDVDILEKMLEERDAIFTWMVQGAVRWYAEGLGELPEQVMAMNRAVRGSNDVLGSFLSEETETGQYDSTPVADAYDSFKAWCYANGIKDVPKRLSWKRDIEKRGYPIEREGAHARESFKGFALTADPGGWRG